MNLQATKLELMQLILESKNKDLLHALLRMLQSSGGPSTSVVKLTASEKQAVQEGLDDFENGRFTDFEEFMKEFR